MATSTNFNESTLEDNGRVLLRSNAKPSVRDSFDVAIKGTAGSGTIALQVSYEETPVLATDAHWITINGADDLDVDRVYSVDILSYSAIALSLTGATSPDLTVIWGK
jgi:hypothetical protein